MKTFSIAGLEIKNRYVQAPLAGYTAFAMREMARIYGAGLTYTEMTSCTALNYHNKKTYQMMPHKKEDGPVAFQIFGGDEENIFRAIPFINDNSVFDFLDFNLGCPAKKVLKQKAGSYWLTKPDELYRMMRKAVMLSSRPVIAKIRIGYDSVNLLTVGKLLSEAGVKCLAVHGRTTKEGFVGPVHYDLIGELKRNLSIPIIANGNIDVSDIDEVEKITGADAFMIGRGAVGNPKIFEDLINHEEGREIRKADIYEQIDNIVRHLDMQIEEKGEEPACSVLRGLSTFYLKGLPDVKQLKIKLVRCSSRQDYIDVLDPYLKKDRKI